MAPEDGEGTADAVTERASGSAWRLKLLMGTNRLLLTAAFTVAVFATFVVVVTVLPPPLRASIARSSMIDVMFSSLITAIVTGSTIVVSVGQLVLSQENGPLGDQRQRMSNTMDVRGFASEILDGPVPADPAAFLRELVAETGERASALRESIRSHDDDGVRSDVSSLADSVVGNADYVTGELAGESFGSFDVVFAALDFNYSWKIVRVEHVLSDYGDVLTDDQTRRLEELKTALSLYGPVREHVKTLYFQWTLIEFSQLVLYTSLPALVVAGIVVATVDAGTFPGATLGIENVVWVVGAAFAVTLLPFSLFVSYLLRVLTVAKHTLAIGPLILRDSQR